MSARIFVAGATGVLGRRLVPALVAAGHSVTANLRDEVSRGAAESAGADTTTVDLFDPERTAALGADHDVIINVATAIPSGVRALRPSGWSMNDRLRTEASVHLAEAASRDGRRYIGESITFPYIDRGDEWIGEEVERTHFAGNATVVDAESAAASVTAAGGVGVVLRFAMFFADDSAHVDTYRAFARRGICGLTGEPDARISFVHVEDAAEAVVAALDAPPGTYNVAEPDPATRRAHSAALARSVGRRRLRGVPARAVRWGGAALDSVSRSHRISSASLSAVTGWEPTTRVVDAWR